MSSDVTLNPDYDNNRDPFVLPFNPIKWNGRQIDRNEVPSEIEQQIIDLAQQFATSKSKPEVPLNKQIQYYREFQQRFLEETKQIASEVGLTDPPPPLQPISEANYPTLYSWHAYCLENGITFSQGKSHSGGLKEFWKEHKKAIIIAAVVIAIAVTVTVVIVTTAGTGTQVAVVTGAAAAQAAIDAYSSSEELQFESEVQSFAKMIGATGVTKGPIPIIETSSDKSLSGLVSDWAAAIPHPFYPPIDPETVYGVENVARWYKLFGLQTDAAPPQPEARPSSQEFVRLIESKLAEARDPRYTDQFARPSYNQQFVESIEMALATTQNKEKYKIELWKTQHDFAAATQAIAAFFEKTKAMAPLEGLYNTYASTLAAAKPPAPIAEIPLLGYPHQSTIHYHCGIANNYGTVVEGGLCLNERLSNQFAVQPHLIHSNNILAGLSLVQVERLNDLVQNISASDTSLPSSLKWPETILQHSHIHQSIEYEAKNLSQIAQKIIETENPNLKQAHVTFSNGGYVFREALKRLTPEERATIVVITTGTTAIINDDLGECPKSS